MRRAGIPRRGKGEVYIPSVPPRRVIFSSIVIEWRSESTRFSTSAAGGALFWESATEVKKKRITRQK
jgi:hypothetical protein